MFAFIDWGSLDWPHYVAIGGGVVLVLALLLYFLLGRARQGLRIPSIVAGSLGGLALGAGVGIVGMAAFGYQVRQPVASGEDPRANPLVQGNRGGPPGGGFGGPPGGGPRGGFPPGGGGGGGRGSRSKQQLASLVRKLDVLTARPLVINLNSDEKKKVLEQLRGLGKQEELKDDEASARLDALLSALEPHLATLKAAGYQRPGDGPGGRGGFGGGFGGGRQQPSPNPFKQGENEEALKALEKRLTSVTQ
jgi:hypothetical protein